MLETPQKTTMPQSKNSSGTGTISRENDISVLFPYMFGAYLGDGWTTWCHHPVAGFWNTGITCMDREIVERFQVDLSTAFPKRGGGFYKICEFSTKSGTRMYTCSAKNLLAHTVMTGMTASKTKVPDAVIRADFSVVREFIAGLFDTDGGVSETANIARGVDYGPRYILKLSMSEGSVVSTVGELLRRYGVKVGSISTYQKGDYKVQYAIQPNIRSFLDAGFYLGCKRKADRLERWKQIVVASETLYTPSVMSDEDKVQLQ